MLDRTGRSCYNTSCSAGLAHLVERHLAKVEVASSSLVARSRVNQDIRFGCPDFFIRRRELDTDTHAQSAFQSEVRQGSCELRNAIRGMPGSEFEPRSPLQTETGHPIGCPVFSIGRKNLLSLPVRGARISPAEDDRSLRPSSHAKKLSITITPPTRFFTKRVGGAPEKS